IMFRKGLSYQKLLHYLETDDDSDVPDVPDEDDGDGGWENDSDEFMTDSEKLDVGRYEYYGN
ncbi:hypothetical protein JTB14_034163, partial [Gonioctena quinquepunctata]